MARREKIFLKAYLYKNMFSNDVVDVYKSGTKALLYLRFWINKINSRKAIATPYNNLFNQDNIWTTLKRPIPGYWLIYVDMYETDKYVCAMLANCSS